MLEVGTKVYYLPLSWIRDAALGYTPSIKTGYVRGFVGDQRRIIHLSDTPTPSNKPDLMCMPEKVLFETKDEVIIYAQQQIYKQLNDNENMIHSIKNKDTSLKNFINNLDPDERYRLAYIPSTDPFKEG